MNYKNCVIQESQKERFFTLEIFIESVSLNVEKFDKIDPCALGVDLKFIDLPLYRIFQVGFELTKPQRRKETTRDIKYRIVDFNAGKAYTFIKNPNDLIKLIRSSPLVLDVYKIKDILKCPEEVRKDPLANAKVPFPGCLCDQVLMAGNDIHHMPKSYQIKNTFGLIDKEYKPAGLISLFVNLTCIGQSITGEFSIIDKKLLFKIDGSPNEYLCTKVSLPDEEGKKAAENEKKICIPEEEQEESELDASPRMSNVSGLTFVCQQLAKRDANPLNIILPHRKIETSEVLENDRKQNHLSKISKKINPFNTIQRKLYSGRGPCINTGCTGSLCTGTKK